MGTVIFMWAFLLAATSTLAQSTTTPQSIKLTPPVTIAQGQLTGRTRTSDAGTKYLSFQGIPYGKPPVGELRFRAPQPAGAWTGVLAATSEAKICHQFLTPPKPPSGSGGVSSPYGVYKTDEDCLYINVYVPAESLPVDKPIPTMVSIHGGAFQGGSGNEDSLGPDYFMDRGVILVTFNYRLGALGFLSSNTSDAPGNAAMKDQILALRWVRDNIRAFGGDPNQVTIHGVSAGAACVHLLMLSPLSVGLFQRAIMTSGMAPSTFVMAPDPGATSRGLAAAIGASPEVAADPKQRMKFLREATVEDILKGAWAQAFSRFGGLLFLPLAYTPVVEPPASGEESVLAEHPNAILLKGNFNKVPMIIGSNSKEGTLALFGRTADQLITRVNADDGGPLLLTPEEVNPPLDSTKKDQLLNKIKQFYFKDQPISNKTLFTLIDVLSDEIMLHGIYVASRWHVLHATPEAPVYLYHFNRTTYQGLNLILGFPQLNGAGHGDDVGHYFKLNAHNFLPSVTQNATRLDKERREVTELLANFVQYGNPTPFKTKNVDVVWPPAHSPHNQYLLLDDNLEVKDDLLRDRMAFWDEVMYDFTGNALYKYGQQKRQNNAATV